MPNIPDYEGFYYDHYYKGMHMDYRYRFTHFNSVKEPIGKRASITPDEFADYLRKQRPLESKMAAKLISGTIFEPDKPRGTKAAQEVLLLILDIDNATTGGQGEKPVRTQDAVQALEAAGIMAYVVTSYSHTPALHRFRVIIPLQSPVAAKDWPRFALAAIRHLGLTPLEHGIDLKALKDVAHVYFVPSCPVGGKTEFFQVDGEILKPEDVTVGPESGQKSQLSAGATNIEAGQDWSKALSIYKGDLRTLNILALLHEYGVETVENSAGFHYFECFWEDEHSHPGGASAWVIKKPNRLPRFSCWHTSCEERTLVDLLESFEARDVDAHCKTVYDAQSPYNPAEVGKPEIIIDCNLQRMVDLSIEVLAESGVVFRRGDVLVDVPGYMEFLRR